MRAGRFLILGAVILTVPAIAQENARPGLAKAAPEVGASDISISATENVALGEPVEWALPKYPKHARKRGLQGDVVLALRVGVEGDVIGGSVASGDPELAEAAISSARKWQYVPYDVNEKPVEVTTRAIFRFGMMTNRPPDVSVLFNNPPTPALAPVFKVEKGTTAPKAVYSPDPRYSKRARADKFQGNSVLALIVGPDGRPYDIKVSRLLGEGLDAMAIEAVRKWRFSPATKDGKAVAVAINVEVQFRLY